MTAAAEHALRTLADRLGEAAEGMPKDMDLGREIVLALSVAHRETADQLQDERQARERGLYANGGTVRYDPKGGKHGTR
jgi:hypothetical protein